MAYEENMIIKTAWLYYSDNLTQQQISDQLGISRMKVIKLLGKAKSQGIVQFKIRTDSEKRINIGRNLIKKYDLRDVFVIPTSKNNINESIAKAAAQYVESNMIPNCYINIGYGDTISHTINNLIYSLNCHISLVSLSGGVSYYTSSIIAGAHESGSTGFTPSIYIVPSPLIVSSSETAEAILQESAIKEIMNLAGLANMSVVGIGAVDETATIFKDNKINHNDLALLRMNGAVGDILCQFYDKQGKKITCDLHKRTITTQLETLKNFNNVIGVAGGESKVNAIHSALIGGYLDVLITDEETAESLIKLENK
jgi:lsr operon transcriptional repressor